MISRRSMWPFSGALAIVSALCLALPEPVLADPPPWAPAHGYRSKHSEKHGKDRHEKHRHKYKGKKYYAHEEPRDVYYAPDVGIPTGICNRQVLGAILGGAAGGYAGSKIGGGSGQLAATAAGAVIGLIVGGSVGRSMDRLDQACVGQVLEQAETGHRVKWVDPDSRTQYQVVQTRTFKSGDNRYCREYTSGVVVGRRIQTVQGTACRRPDGAWQLVN